MAVRDIHGSRQAGGDNLLWFSQGTALNGLADPNLPPSDCYPPSVKLQYQWRVDTDMAISYVRVLELLPASYVKRTAAVCFLALQFKFDN